MGYAIRLGQYSQTLTLGPALDYFALLIRRRPPISYGKYLQYKRLESRH